MATWSTHLRCSGTPEQVLRLLTEPEAICRWSPVGFELHAFEGERLRAGDHVRVCGSLAGRSIEFLVDVASAGDGRLALTASGPITIDVEYLLDAVEDGCDVRASVGVAGGGLFGRVVARATDTLLAAGALRASLARIAGELEPACACAAVCAGSTEILPRAEPEVSRALRQPERSQLAAGSPARRAPRARG